MNLKSVNWEVEKACLVASPVIYQESVGSWYVRCSSGYTRPANAVHTDADAGETHLSVEEKIAKCEAIYKQKGLNPLFRLTPFSAPELGGVLEQKGYKINEPICVVMTKPLNHTPQEKFSPMFKVMDLDDWLPHFFKIREEEIECFEIQKALLKNLPTSTLFGVLADDKEVYSCGYGVVTENLCGLFGLGTKSEFRNRGYGKQLTSNLLDWAVKKNAHYAYLQVDVVSQPALGMYRSAGFETAFPYWYRLKEF